MIMLICVSFKDFLLLLLLFFLVFLFFVSFIYYVEFYVIDMFFDIFIGIWWLVVIMIIVGYGDMFLKLIFGYFVGGVCVFLGMFILVMLVVIFVMNFNDLY